MYRHLLRHTECIVAQSRTKPRACKCTHVRTYFSIASANSNYSRLKETKVSLLSRTLHSHRLMSPGTSFRLRARHTYHMIPGIAGLHRYHPPARRYPLAAHLSPCKSQGQTKSFHWIGFGFGFCRLNVKEPEPIAAKSANLQKICFTCLYPLESQSIENCSCPEEFFWIHV